jgi:hypothetical protein
VAIRNLTESPFFLHHSELLYMHIVSDRCGALL